MGDEIKARTREAQASRKQRLAEELRANLRRRKEAARREKAERAAPSGNGRGSPDEESP
jgi:hypothetical protein